MRLKRDFFTHSTFEVAKNILGTYLIRKLKNKILIGKIVEVEVYLGPKDKASHAYAKKEQSFREKLKIIESQWKKIKNYIEDKKSFLKKISQLKNAKLTPRNLAEYLRGGHIYIYLVYGKYYQLNVTTFKEGYPECILIRSLEPILNLQNPKGPGKVCQEMKLDKFFWGEDLCQSKRIWLSKNFLSCLNKKDYKFLNHIKENKNKKIAKSKRIGIDYAQEYKDKLWRFYLKNNLWVCKN